MSAEVPKIQDYAIIGNGRSAALVSNRGAIDWLCWPRFDSAAIFAAILDPKIGGHWSVRPAQQSNTSRRYIDNTNVGKNCRDRFHAGYVGRKKASITLARARAR